MSARLSPVRQSTIRDPATRATVRRIALFLAILLSGGNLIFPREPMIALLIGIGFLLAGPAHLLRRELWAVWLLLFVMLIVSVIGGDGLHVESTITRYANFFGAVMLLVIYLDEPRGTLSRDVFPLFVFFAIQAILTVFLAFVVPDLFTVSEIGETVYYTIGYVFTYHETIVIPGGLQRPDGFFFEPGVLQIYLNLYLYIALFVFRRYKHAALAVVGVLSTQSTTGVMITVVICGIAYWRHLRNAGLNERLLVLIITPLMLAPLVLVARANLQEKLTGVFRGSSLAREYDFYTGLRIITEYPLTGIGFDQERYLDIASRLGYFETLLSLDAALERTSSNGILTAAYMIGIPLFLVVMWALARQRFFPDRLVLFLILFMSFLSEVLVFNPFFMMIIFSGLLLSRVAAPARGRLRTA